MENNDRKRPITSVSFNQESATKNRYRSPSREVYLRHSRYSHPSPESRDSLLSPLPSLSITLHQDISPLDDDHSRFIQPSPPLPQVDNSSPSPSPPIPSHVYSSCPTKTSSSSHVKTTNFSFHDDSPRASDSPSNLPHYSSLPPPRPSSAPLIEEVDEDGIDYVEAVAVDGAPLLDDLAETYFSRLGQLAWCMQVERGTSIFFTFYVGFAHKTRFFLIRDFHCHSQFFTW